MSFRVPIREMAQLAAKAEEGGLSFYRRIAGMAKDQKVKQVCMFFAEQEQEHKGFFEKIATETKAEVTGNFSVNVVSLLNQGINRLKETGFQSRDLDFSQMDTGQCLELALRLELETIAIYEEIRQAMDTNYNVVLYKIIHEERQHAESIENVMKTREPEKKRPPREAKIVQPDKIVIQKRKVVHNFQDYMYVVIILLFLVGIILAMVGPRHISYIVNVITGK